MVGRRVIRKVDSPGNISFAGTSYRVGNAYRRQQVEVAVVGDTVESQPVADSFAPTPPNTTLTVPTVRLPTPQAEPSG
ncbi:MAG: hypothetical protein ACXW1Y_05545, partial [Acidimicrobiia bacterium]